MITSTKQALLHIAEMFSEPVEPECFMHHSLGICDTVLNLCDDKQIDHSVHKNIDELLQYYRSIYCIYDDFFFPPLLKYAPQRAQVCRQLAEICYEN